MNRDEHLTYLNEIELRFVVCVEINPFLFSRLCTKLALGWRGNEIVIFETLLPANI